MILSSLLVCADESASSVLRRVHEELDIRFEFCSDPVRAAVRLAQARFDLIVLDCAKQSDVTRLLEESRASHTNQLSMAILVVAGQEHIRDMFSLGVNFVLYKPVSYESALSTLRAAQSVLFRDKRHKARLPVHAHATIDYADVAQARATLVDLGEDGMAVNFGKKLPPTSKVYFQFQLPGQKSAVRLSGQVMWQDWNGRAGIQFLDVPKTSRRILNDWLQANLSEASQNALAADRVEVEHSLKPSESSAAPEVAKRDPHPAKHELQTSAEKYSPKKPMHDQKGASNERQAVARLRSERDNRRGQTRYACRIGAEVYRQGSSVRNYCQLSDLSPGGCYLEMPLAFPSGTPVEIIVRTHEMKLRLSGQVKASHPGYGMGIAFLLNTNAERQGVQQLIDFVATTTAESPS